MLAHLRRAALRRGLFGGSWPWLAVGAVTWGVVALRYAAKRPSAAVWKGAVGDDEIIEIVTRKPGTPTS
jgi:hypothetical protein